MRTEQDIMNLWTPLPGDYGEFFSIHGKAIAGVQANRFILWQEGEKKYEVRSSYECGSYPRWADSMIFWNDSRLDIVTGNVYSLDIMNKDFLENTDMPDPSGRIMRGYRPVTYAWSPNSDLFILSVEGTDKNGMAHSRVLLLDKDGSLLNNLWEGHDFAPVAACINSEYIIAGTREPRIFDKSGKLVIKLPGEMIPQRIHISDNGSVILIQTYESITLWESGTWIRKGYIKGPWLNAALDSDGKMIYVVDFEGKLNAARVSDSIDAMKKIPAPAPIATVDSGSEYIIASFAQGDPVRWALKEELDNLIIKNR
jgi:hypothetical protein